MSRPFASPIPENSRKKRANIYDPLPTIPSRTTRSQSTSREPTFPQPSVTPTRSSPSAFDENIDPSSAIFRVPQMASQESTQSSSKGGISHHDLNDFYCKITEKFAHSLESISRHVSTSGSTPQILNNCAFDPSPAAFLKTFPSCWSPLSLKCPQCVLLVRLDAIWELSNKDFKLAKRNILMLLDEESQLSVTIAHESLSDKEEVSKSKWTNAILSINGPKLHSIYKQIIDPAPFKDETLLQFATRLAVSTARCDKHPCPDLALDRLQCLVRPYAEFFGVQSAKDWEAALEEMHSICVTHLTTTGQELRPRSRQQPSTSTTSTTTPSQPSSTTTPSNICSHCGKKGHSIEKCWKRDPSLKERFRKNVNVVHINESQRSTSSRNPDAFQRSPNYSPSSSQATQPASPSLQPHPLPSRPDLNPGMAMSIPDLCNKLVQHMRSSKTSVPNGDILDGLNFSQSAILNPISSRPQRITPVYEDFPEDVLPQPLGELFSILSSSSTSPSPQRPEKTLFLPNRNKSIKFLLDTGADENVLNLKTAIQLGIPVSKVPTGKFKVAGGESYVFGCIEVLVRIDECDRIFRFFIMNCVPNLIGWPLINKYKLLSECYIVNQPKLPVFPASINALLQKCSPTTPMRVARFNVENLGNHSPPSIPIQATARPLSTVKLQYLESFISKMRDNDVIEKGLSGDFLSPIHLVPKYDKDHRPLPQQYRCTIDMTKVNSTFDKMPCPIPSAPTTAASLASYKNKVVVDIKDGFFHIEIPPSLRKFFGVITKIGIFRFKRLIQGFLNSPTIFQTMMMQSIDFPVLRQILELNMDADIVTFLDDVGAGTNDDCPYQLLAMILERCIEANLTVVPSSIQVGREVVHLGKLLTKRCEISIAARHREAILILKARLLKIQLHNNLALKERSQAK